MSNEQHDEEEHTMDIVRIVDTVDPLREIMLLFESHNKNPATLGTDRGFMLKAFFIFAAVAAFKFLFNEYVPSVAEMIVIPVMLALTIIGMVMLFRRIGKYATERPVVVPLIILALIAFIAIV